VGERTLLRIGIGVGLVYCQTCRKTMQSAGTVQQPIHHVRRRGIDDMPWYWGVLEGPGEAVWSAPCPRRAPLGRAFRSRLGQQAERDIREVSLEKSTPVVRRGRRAGRLSEGEKGQPPKVS
jgi:hypothetical protein